MNPPRPPGRPEAPPPPASRAEGGWRRAPVPPGGRRYSRAGGARRTGRRVPPTERRPGSHRRPARLCRSPASVRWPGPARTSARLTPAPAPLPLRPAGPSAEPSRAARPEATRDGTGQLRRANFSPAGWAASILGETPARPPLGDGGEAARDPASPSRRPPPPSLLCGAGWPGVGQLR